MRWRSPADPPQPRRPSVPHIPPAKERHARVLSPEPPGRLSPLSVCWVGYLGRCGAHTDVGRCWCRPEIELDARSYREIMNSPWNWANTGTAAASVVMHYKHPVRRRRGHCRSAGTWAVTQGSPAARIRKSGGTSPAAASLWSVCVHTLFNSERNLGIGAHRRSPRLTSQLPGIIPDDLMDSGMRA